MGGLGGWVGRGSSSRTLARCDPGQVRPCPGATPAPAEGRSRRGPLGTRRVGPGKEAGVGRDGPARVRGARERGAGVAGRDILHAGAAWRAGGGGWGGRRWMGWVEARVGVVGLGGAYGVERLEVQAGGGVGDAGQLDRQRVERTWWGPARPIRYRPGLLRVLGGEVWEGGMEGGMLWRAALEGWVQAGLDLLQEKRLRGTKRAVENQEGDRDARLSRGRCWPLGPIHALHPYPFASAKAPTSRDSRPPASPPAAGGRLGRQRPPDPQRARPGPLPGAAHTRPMVGPLPGAAHTRPMVGPLPGAASCSSSR
jgi:hypothetical protein